MNENPGKQLEHLQVKEQQAFKPPCSKLSLLAHDLESPNNIGSLFRLADALGIQHIYLSGCTPTPPNRKLSRVSRQTERWVSHSTHQEVDPLLTALKDQGIKLIALEITEQSIELNHFCAALNPQKAETSSYCLVLGNEKNGISQELLQYCQAAVHIPMQGHNSSMNVVTAASIACYQIINSLN